MWVWVVIVVLSLLPFFHWFRGTPHQLAAIKELEESLPQELLDDDAAWFDAWKTSGIDQQVYTPYFSQLDNASGQGHRECFSSAAAMVAAFYRKVETDDEYNYVRQGFGDSTVIGAQIETLKTLGLNVEFRIDGDAEMIEMDKKDLDHLKTKKTDYEDKLKIFLLPKDEDDDKNAIVEIREGTGGLEASLFCSD